MRAIRLHDDRDRRTVSAAQLVSRANQPPLWLQLSLQYVVSVRIRSRSPSFTAQVRRLTEPRRTRADPIKINWQCGGQGFESPSAPPS